MKHKLLLALILFQFSISKFQFLQAQSFSARGLTYRNPEMAWVDETIKSMSLEQRIAQLMVVRVPLNMDDKRAQEFSQRMNRYGVGGVCFFAGTAQRQVALTRRFQHDARIPLLVCIDGEWGLGMRLKDTYSFPRNALLGRLTPDYDSLVYRMGEEIGRQCRMMGIHINFAPVVDINSNPRNPVIGTRSFGTDRERVSQLGIMYALGQQSQGVIATAKHFPGHGDTETDSHFELPVINHSRAYIDSVDTYPFRRLIQAGVQGVMVAHLQVNALDPKRPSSLSPAVVTDLLRNELGFQGLIITDGLDMKGVTNSYGNGRGELAALIAGNDILLLPPDVEKAIQLIKTEADNNDSIRQLVDYHCRRVLRAKYRHVLPYINHIPVVPNEDNLQVCRNIDADIQLNADRRIDTLIQNAIAAKAMPGCQVVVMHNGRMVMNRSYGNTSYDSLPVPYAEITAPVPVTPNTLYDLASLTKVCATTLAIMKLVDDGKLKIDDRLSKYLPYLKDTDKESITIKEAMSHQARLKPFDNYWQLTSNRDSILQLVAQSPLNSKEGYCYSDLGFMLLCDLVQQVTGLPLDRYVQEQFYEPMHLTHTTFNPLPATSYQLSAINIAPTEVDTIRGIIWGQVHDPNAHAMGGVSGHAGLFANAADVAQLMQMLLDGGLYQGRRYLKQKTIDTFTRRHFEKQGNRRALGFDKQLLAPAKNAQTSFQASQNSYGHTGFTGTMLWVDPDYQLVYVFLSNRVHPSATPNLLAQINLRTDIQSIIYSILKKAASR